MAVYTVRLITRERGWCQLLLGKMILKAAMYAMMTMNERRRHAHVQLSSTCHENIQRQKSTGQLTSENDLSMAPFIGDERSAQASKPM